MSIIIVIKNKITKLILKKEKKVFDELVFLDKENISEKLLVLFDKLLKNNNLTTKDIKNIEIETDLGDTFTSRRIAEAMKKAFIWGKK